MFQSFRRENLAGPRMMQFQSPEQAEFSSAWASSIYNPEYMDEFAVSHLPQVELVKENMTKIETILKRGTDEAHTGKFLLCRVLEVHSISEFTVGFTLDDPDGKYSLMLLFISPGVVLQKGEPVKLNIEDFVASIPVGSVIALMHPWLTMSKKLESRNPNHIVVLGKHHPLFDDGSIYFKAPSPGRSNVKSYDNLEPKDAGVKYFGAKNYIMALECFTKALKNCEDKESFARQYANRAMTYLCLGRSHLALEDAEKGLELEPKNVKLVYRKAKALFQLKRYSICAEFLKNHGSDFIDNKDLNDLHSKAEIAHRECQTGRYDLEKMTEEVKKNPVLEDHADYFDERVEFRRPIGEAERAAIAKDTIPAGTLIMACKAFAFYPKVGKFSCKMCKLEGAHEHPEVMVEPWHEIVSICSAKFSTVPSLLEEFKVLGKFEDEKECKEEEESSESDSELPEEFRNEEEKNRGTDRFAYGERYEIENICKDNLFFPTDPNTKKVYSGFWIRPSFIKWGSKDPNCSKTFIGNYMFVRTSKEVKAGEELSFAKEKEEK